MPPKTRARAAKSPLTPIEDIVDGRSSKKGGKKGGKHTPKTPKSKNNRNVAANTADIDSTPSSSRTRTTISNRGHSHEHKHHPECDPYNDAIQVILAGLYILRIILCLWPQHGYLHENEFFHFSEPIAGDIFQSKVIIREEYDHRYPTASPFFPLMIAGPPFGVLSALSDVFGYTTNQLVSNGNNPKDGDAGHGHALPPVYWVLVLPRLIVTLLSFIVDWCLARFLLPFVTNDPKSYDPKIASFGTISVNNIRLMFATSFISLTFMTRTLSNSIEVIIFTVLLLNAIVYHKLSPSAKDSIKWTGHAIGCMLSVGMFNNPSFLVLASVPVIWSIVGHHKIRCIKDSVQKMFMLTPMFIFQSIVFIAFDTTYFSDIMDINWASLPMSSYYDVIKAKIVLTPANFMAKNMVSMTSFGADGDNSNSTSDQLFGLLPPRMTHLLINLPIIINILIIPLIWDILRTIYNLMTGSIKSINKNVGVDGLMMIATLIIYMASVSLSPNQDMRTLVPLIVPICYLYRSLIRSKTFASLWIICNILLAIFYGHLLDAGVTKSALYMHDVVHGLNMDTSVQRLGHQHIIYTSMKQTPISLLNIGHDDNLIRIFDYTNKAFPDNVHHHFNLLNGKNMTSKVTSYLIAPSCLDDNVNAILRNMITNVGVQKMENIFPHLSVDLIGKSIDVFIINNYDFFKAFSVSIWKIN